MAEKKIIMREQKVKSKIRRLKIRKLGAVPKTKKQKVSIVIPVYKPEMEVFAKVKKMIKKQTIKAEIVEMWNNPEAVSMNKGIKKANGRIVVTLAQDCVPQNKYWLQKLIKPLEKKEIAVSVSDLYLSEDYWKKYPLLTKILTLKERAVRRPTMDARACAFRKKDLLNIGLFSEDPKVIAIDADLKIKLKKMGRIHHPNVVVEHLHPLNNQKEIRVLYNYAEANGKLLKNGLIKESIWKYFLRATPVLGLLPVFYVFPFKRYPHWFPLYVLFSPLQHIIYLAGFWKGFLFDKESIRNIEVLEKNKTI